MSKVAIVFWSATGNTETMANCIAEGAGAAATIVPCAEMDAAKLGEYDVVAFGCPAMGSEVLEDMEFEPMFDGCKSSLKGKRVALFGSYGWGGGEWMHNWERDCRSSGIQLACDSVICNEAPDDAALAACQALGKALVG
jgi:flavodoxin I